MKLRPPLDKVLIGGIILIIMSIAVSVILARSIFNSYKENTQLVNQSKEVFLLSEKLLFNAELTFSTLKNYANSDSIADYSQIIKTDSITRKDLIAFKKIVGQNEEQKQQIDTLGKTIDQYILFSSTLLNDIIAGKKVKVLTSLNNEDTKSKLHTIEKLVFQLQKTDAALLASHRLVHDENATKNRIVVFVLVLLIIFLLVMISLRFRHNYKSFSQKELIESENKYRLLVESAPDAMVIYQNGKIAYVNSRTVQMMKANSKDDLIGKSVLEFIYPDQRDFVLSRMQQILSTRVPLPIAEEKFICFDGSLIEVEVKSIPIKFNGEIAAQAIIRDISERKKAENLLKASEERYRSIITASPDGVVITDLQGKCLIASPVAQKIYGVNEEDIIGSLITDFIVAADRERAQSNLALMFQGVMTGPGEYLGIHQSGSFFNMEANAEFIKDEKGHPQQIVFIIRDITRRKKEAAIIIKNEKSLNEAQRIGKIGSWEFNHQTGELIWSDQLFEIVQRDPKIFQPSFEYFFEMLLPEEADMVKAAFENSIKNHHKYDNVHKVVLPNKGIKYLHQQGETIYDEAGNPLVSIGTTQDITDVKREEEKLAKTNRLFLFISMINQMIVRTTNELTLFEEVCKIAVTVGHFKMAWVGKIDQVTSLVCPIVHAGDERGYLALLNNISLIKEKPESKGPTARSILERKYVVCNDIENDPAMKMWKEAALVRGFYSSISLPVLKFGNAIGTISIYAGVKDFFDETEIALLEEVTSNISFALEIFEKEAERKIATDKIRALTAHILNIREEERKRIGREIHDDLGQQLTAIKMDVAWLGKKIPAESELLQTKISNINNLLDASNKAVRRILNELRPGILDDYGLLGALEMLNTQFEKSTGIIVDFVTNVAELKLPVPAAICIFRVFQEAFTNITKYAEANSVTSSLTVLDGHILINIDDDGKGFDPTTIKSKKSFGLVGMKERVFSLGGSFEVNSSPDKGTRIIISLPLEPR